jgi:hypothetical protein
METPLNRQSVIYCPVPESFIPTPPPMLCIDTLRIAHLLTKTKQIDLSLLNRVVFYFS